MGFIVPAAILAAKAGKAYFANKSKKKATNAQRSATISGLNIQQKQREDERRARLNLGVSMINGVPATTAGGTVNTNVGLDPELIRQLGLERTYDFGSAVPDANSGAFEEFLSGLFGGTGDVLTRTGSMGDVSGGPAGYGRLNGTGGILSGGAPPSGSPTVSTPPTSPTTVNWEDLMGQLASHGGGTY